MTAPVILVTGAARRVGAEISRALHDSGAHVVIHYHRSEYEAKRLVDKLNQTRAGSASRVQGDLNATTTPDALITSIMAQHQRLDGVVNNASTFYPTPLGKITPEMWEDLMASNVKGPLFLSQAAAPYLRKTNGAIVNIIDIHAQRPLKNYALYCTAKAALHGLTHALALELAPHVRVNGIAPGAIEWPETPLFPDDERQAILQRTPLQRKGSLSDIARTVLFLLQDAPYVTGQIIAVDGGRSIML